MNMNNKELKINSFKSFCDNIITDQKNYYITLFFVCMLLIVSIYNTVTYMKFRELDVNINLESVESVDELYIGTVENYSLKSDLYRYYSYTSVKIMQNEADKIKWDKYVYSEDTDGYSAEPLLPDLKISGLLILGNKSRVKLSIDGVPSEKIFKPGDTFYSGKGKILKINKKGVTWLWKGQIKNTSL